MAAVEISPREVGLSIKVRWPRGYSLRLWIVCRLFALIELVSPHPAEVSVEVAQRD